jgi:V8-like Glu-specific endopeptidase
MAGNWKPISGIGASIELLARSTAAIVDIGNWEKFTSNSYRIKGAFATGFLYGSKKIITAGHVIDDNKIKQAIVVFDYLTDNNGGAIISSENIYVIDKIDRDYDDDCGCIVLTNPVNRNGLVIREFISKDEDTHSVDYDKEGFAIGHPGGQPARYSGVATLKPLSNGQKSFLAGFSVSEGASGAPVFSLRDNAVVGLVIEKSKTQAKCLKGDVLIAMV